MSHLDTAAASRSIEGRDPRTVHYVASIGRSVTVIETSVGLGRGDRVDGPPHAQLLVVSEATEGGEAGERLNAAVMDAIARELVRHDDWLVSLCDGRSGHVAESLASAVKAASESLSHFRSPEKKRGDRPLVALTTALVAWPCVAVAHAGDGVVVRVAGDRAIVPLKPHTASAVVNAVLPDAEGDGALDRVAADGLGGESPPAVETWSAELGERDLLILGTGALRRSALAEVDSLPERLSPADRSEKIVADLLGAVPYQDDASVAVAKLSKGAAEQMQELSEDVAPREEDRTDKPQLVEAREPRAQGLDNEATR